MAGFFAGVRAVYSVPTSFEPAFDRCPPEVLNHLCAVGEVEKMYIPPVMDPKLGISTCNESCCFFILPCMLMGGSLTSRAVFFPFSGGGNDVLCCFISFLAVKCLRPLLFQWCLRGQPATCLSEASTKIK